MAIEYNAARRIFTLQTMHTSYQMQADGFGHLLHLYYGPRIEGVSSYMLQMRDRGFHGNPSEAGGADGRGRDRTYSLDTLPQEYPCAGSGDQRSTALSIRDAQALQVDTTLSFDTTGMEIKVQKHLQRSSVLSATQISTILQIC
jgi:alpha-galactosidase